MIRLSILLLIILIGCANGKKDAISTLVDSLENPAVAPTPTPSPSNGINSLVNTIAASASVCPTGGTIIQSGLDKNQNGVLDPSEVTGTSIVCNGASASPLTITEPIEPCGANSSQFKEVLLGLSDGQILAEFSGSSDATTVRNTLLTDGTYADTDSSECLFNVTTDTNGDRVIIWTGTSQNGSGPYPPGQANYTAETQTWSVSY